MFVICIEAIMYLLLYNLHECTFKPCNLGNVFQNSSIPVNIQSSTFRLFKWFTVQKMETGYTSQNVKSTAFQKTKIKYASHKVGLVLPHQFIFHDLLLSKLRNALANA